MAESPRFGTVFAPSMGTMSFDGSSWSDPAVVPVEAIPMHPSTHALHYSSSCFEGLKAHRDPNGGVNLFRLDRHVERFAASADRLVLPFPGVEAVRDLITETVAANLDEVPNPPGSLYVRPTLVGTDHDIGAAGSPSRTALLFVLNSPVGDYFAGGVRPLRIAVETDRPRTTPQFGAVKSGANYVMALGVTMEAKRKFDASQVIFMPGGQLNETGAANVVLLSEDRLITPPLDGSFLAGVTRDSLLTLASESGMEVEERAVDLDELRAWVSDNEVALAGTAAVLAPVGTLIIDGVDVTVGSGEVGPVTLRLREALAAVQVGVSSNHPEWRSPVVKN